MSTQYNVVPFHEGCAACGTNTAAALANAEAENLDSLKRWYGGEVPNFPELSTEAHGVTVTRVETPETYTEDEIGFFAEAQGPFAPETLSGSATDDVFSRRFTSAEHMIDVSAAPTIPQPHDPLSDEPVELWEVTVCTETRDAGDEGGDTSDYEWETITDELVTYDRAVEIARAYIIGLDPATAF